MTMRHSLVVACLALLAACSGPGRGLDARMQALVGKPEGELVSRLGPPDADAIVGGRHFLRWDNLAPAPPVQVGPGAGFGLSGAPLSGQGIGNSPAASRPLGASCSVRFEIVQGRAIGYVLDGLACDTVR